MKEQPYHFQGVNSKAITIEAKSLSKKVQAGVVDFLKKTFFEKLNLSSLIGGSSLYEYWRHLKEKQKEKKDAGLALVLALDKCFYSLMNCSMFIRKKEKLANIILQNEGFVPELVNHRFFRRANQASTIVQGVVMHHPGVRGSIIGIPIPITQRRELLEQEFLEAIKTYNQQVIAFAENVSALHLAMFRYIDLRKETGLQKSLKKIR